MNKFEGATSKNVSLIFYLGTNYRIYTGSDLVDTYLDNQSSPFLGLQTGLGGGEHPYGFSGFFINK